MCVEVYRRADSSDTSPFEHIGSSELHDPLAAVNDVVYRELGMYARVNEAYLVEVAEQEPKQFTIIEITASQELAYR